MTLIWLQELLHRCSPLLGLCVRRKPRRKPPPQTRWWGRRQTAPWSIRWRNTCWPLLRLSCSTDPLLETEKTFGHLWWSWFKKKKVHAKDIQQLVIAPWQEPSGGRCCEAWWRPPRFPRPDSAERSRSPRSTARTSPSAAGPGPDSLSHTARGGTLATSRYASAQIWNTQRGRRSWRWKKINVGKSTPDVELRQRKSKEVKRSTF